MFFSTKFSRWKGHKDIITKKEAFSEVVSQIFESVDVYVFLICRHCLAYVCWRFLLLQGHRRSANCFRGVHFLFRATCGVFRSLSPSICFLLFQDHFCPQKKSSTRWNHFASFQSWRLTVKHKGCEKPKEDTGRNSHPKMYLLKTWNMFG